MEYIDKWTRSYSLVIIYIKMVQNIFKGSVSHNTFLVLAGNLKVGKPILCCCLYFKLNTDSFIWSRYYNICMLISDFFWGGNSLIGYKRATLITQQISTLNEIIDHFYHFILIYKQYMDSKIIFFLWGTYCFDLVVGKLNHKFK